MDRVARFPRFVVIGRGISPIQRAIGPASVPPTPRATPPKCPLHGPFGNRGTGHRSCPFSRGREAGSLSTEAAMDWIRENWFWIVVGVLFIWLHGKMHGGHGHAGH